VSENDADVPGAWFCKLADRPALNRLSLRGRGRPVDQEHGALHLLDVVESDEPDVGTRESLGACLHLRHNLSSVSASEHRELPHSPVPVVVVQDGGRSSETDGVLGGNVGLVRLGELQARGPSIADNVVDLLDDLGLRQRGEEGESLEELVVDRVPDLREITRRGGVSVACVGGSSGHTRTHGVATPTSERAPRPPNSHDRYLNYPFKVT
jgi:hypothetical protein